MVCFSRLVQFQVVVTSLSDVLHANCFRDAQDLRLPVTRLCGFVIRDMPKHAVKLGASLTTMTGSRRDSIAFPQLLWSFKCYLMWSTPFHSIRKWVYLKKTLVHNGKVLPKKTSDYDYFSSNVFIFLSFFSSNISVKGAEVEFYVKYLKKTD